MKNQNYYIISAAYGEGSYNTSTYTGQTGTTPTGTTNPGTTTNTGGTSSSTTPPSNTDTGSTGALANTGLNLLVIATLACVIIFVALLVRFGRKPNNSSSN